MQTVQILAETGEKSTGLAALGLDPLAILAQATTFLVLFFVIKKFALQKIIDTLEKRRKTIDDGLRLGRAMEAEKEQLDEKVEQALKSARVEADKIIAAGHQEAGEILKAAEVSVSRKVDALLNEANAKINEDINHARLALEKEILSLVADTTTVVISEKLDPKKDAELLTKALKQARHV